MLKSVRAQDRYREFSFVVMPRYRTTLSEYLNKYHKLGPGRAEYRNMLGELLVAFYSISEMLHFMHTQLKRSLVYIDLKPANVVFDDLQKPVLIDYGLVGTDLETTLAR